MKRLLLYTSISIFILFLISIYSNTIKDINANSNKTVLSANTIVIDAGHGGKDVGALGVDGAFEKDMNLEIALDLYDFLMVSGVNSVLTRDGDYETYLPNDNRNRSDLYNRMDLVNSIQNSILVSIHQNHFDNESEWGAQVWYAPNSTKSEELASNVLSSINANLMPKNKRENKESDNSYYLLYKAKSPSIMVECGFISNSEENKKLQTSEYQNDMAFSIFTGMYGDV